MRNSGGSQHWCPLDGGAAEHLVVTAPSQFSGRQFGGTGKVLAACKHIHISTTCNVQGREYDVLGGMVADGGINNRV